MNTGKYSRETIHEEIEWIVEGTFKKTGRKAYPHQGWSWTQWVAEDQPYDTYKSYDSARSAISTGYLKDMIKHQDVVNIRFYQIKRNICTKTDYDVVAYDRNQIELAVVEPT